MAGTRQGRRIIHRIVRKSLACAEDIRQQVGVCLSPILDGGPTTGYIPSAIVDMIGPNLKMLRQEAIRVES